MELKPSLEKFRTVLQSKRDSLSKEILAATSEIINDEEVFADSVDQAAADTGRTLNVQMQNRERESLSKLDAALRKIEAGSFGLCESCGDDISEARIMANLETTLCISCQMELESERQRFSNRR
jgi:DnaK suppressor protein